MRYVLVQCGRVTFWLSLETKPFHPEVSPIRSFPNEGRREGRNEAETKRDRAPIGPYGRAAL